MDVGLSPGLGLSRGQPTCNVSVADFRFRVIYFHLTHLRDRGCLLNYCSHTFSTGLESQCVSCLYQCISTCVLRVVYVCIFSVFVRLHIQSVCVFLRLCVQRTCWILLMSLFIVQSTDVLS